jgi:16S rRNA (guanine966-N2)-methyltransferase
MAWLRQNTRRFDIVFLDPPYRTGLLNQCCRLLEDRKSLAENAKIYIEHAPGDKDISVPDNWKCLKQKSAGQVVYKLFSRA